MVFADAALCQTVPKGILRAGHLSPQGWSLTHRKSTSRDWLFATKHWARKTSPYRAYLLVSQAPERARVESRTRCFISPSLHLS